MKTVLVTGSSHGLGASIIKKFASCGYNTIINYKNSKEDALNLKEYIENTYKVKTYIYKCDVSKENEVVTIFNKIKEDIGYIDCIVNNAGICNDLPIDEKTSESFMNTLENNTLSTYLVSKHGAKLIKEGSIINIISNNIYEGSYIESVDYDASKSALVSLTYNFAKYLAPNVRVCAVAPGWIETNMTKDMDLNFKNEEISKILLKRFATSDEIADAVYFLASNTYVNSTILRIDGGTK